MNQLDRFGTGICAVPDQVTVVGGETDHPGKDQAAAIRERLAGPVVEIAPTLLGARLSHAGVIVRITEVEAYAGDRDPASHAYRGRTPRNAVMFGPPGHLYVYFTYGMHHACNVVCGPTDVASGVLIRAGEVIDGIELAAERRGSRIRHRDLARGPGRLAQALGLDLSFRGADLLGAGPVQLDCDGAGSSVSPDRVRTGPRVGVSAAADWPWRFWIADDPYVSDYKRSPRAPVSPATS